jgi:signal peptidase I
MSLGRPLRWLAGAAVAVVLVLALEHWVAKPYRVTSGSMEPRLRAGDGVLVNRLTYRFRDPRRGEIVVVRPPAAALRRCGASGALFKRVVGLPGETVSERDGFVSIDGRRLNEPYVDLFRRDHAPQRVWRVPRDGYFVMGDNRAQSCDSRAFGAVPRADVVGEAMLVYWPPDRFGAGL